MSEANVSATNQDGLIEITDGARSYFVDLEPGDFSFQDGKADAVINLTRERIAPLSGGPPDMRLGSETPASGSFTVRQRSLSSTTDETLLDLLRWQAGDTNSYVANNWASTHPYSDVRTVTLKHHLSGVYRGVADQAQVWDYVHLQAASGQEGNPSTLTVNWVAGVSRPRIE